MSTGTECAWLRSPILPKAFVLELLDFVLGANARTFQMSPIFEHALLSRVRFHVRDSARGGFLTSSSHQKHWSCLLETTSAVSIELHVPVAVFLLLR